MTPLRALAGFPEAPADRIAIVRSDRKTAMPWQQESATKVVYDPRTKTSKLVSRFVRRDPFGKLIADILQKDVACEWTAEGMTAQAMGSLNLGKTRTAATLSLAMLDADSHLEAEGWMISGSLILISSFE
jgi:hypothetical protein